MVQILLPHTFIEAESRTRCTVWYDRMTGLATGCEYKRGVKKGVVEFQQYGPPHYEDYEAILDLITESLKQKPAPAAPKPSPILDVTGTPFPSGGD